MDAALRVLFAEYAGTLVEWLGPHLFADLHGALTTALAVPANRVRVLAYLESARIARHPRLDTLVEEVIVACVETCDRVSQLQQRALRKYADHKASEKPPALRTRRHRAALGLLRDYVTAAEHAAIADILGKSASTAMEADPTPKPRRPRVDADRIAGENAVYALLRATAMQSAHLFTVRIVEQIVPRRGSNRTDGSNTRVVGGIQNFVAPDAALLSRARALRTRAAPSYNKRGD